MLAPAAARAQVVERLGLHVDGGISALLSSPESDLYALGFAFGVRPSVRLVGPLWAHLNGSYARWGEGASPNGPAALWTLGGGLTVAPVISPRAGRLLVQAEGGLGLTGASVSSRASLGGAVGWLIPLGRSAIELGPVLRFGAVLADGSPGSSAALLGTAGVSVGLRAPLHRLVRADRDRDGVDDSDDLCPGDPAGVRPDPARAGCPVFDRDGDGVPDAEDSCADEPAGERPDGAQRGCPVRDADHDGVPDSNDRCPGAREDTDGFEDADGCPDLDNDRDGVADASDRCPNEPEIVNQHLDDDGCPDDPPSVIASPEGGVTLRTPPRFMAGSATLDPASHSALDAFATALQARGDPRRVTVICHAEAPGDRAAVRLARQRAAALARYLTQRGVRRPRARGVVGDPPGEARVEVELRASRASGAPERTRRHRRRHR